MPLPHRAPWLRKALLPPSPASQHLIADFSGADVLGVSREGPPQPRPRFCVGRRSGQLRAAGKGYTPTSPRAGRTDGMQNCLAAYAEQLGRSPGTPDRSTRRPTSRSVSRRCPSAWKQQQEGSKPRSSGVAGGADGPSFGGYRENGASGDRSPTDQRWPNGSVKPPCR